MIFLDTHIIVWLYEGTLEKFPRPIKKALDENELFYSAAVELELELLYEIGRLKASSARILENLHAHIGIKVSNVEFHRVVEEAKNIKWTRDPFDRLIVANASIFNEFLITKDNLIRKKYPLTRWGSS